MATCSFPMCLRFAQSNGLCISHKMYAKVDIQKDASAKISFASDRRKVDQREYVKMIKEMIAENPYCEIQAPGCHGKMTGAHHMKKRTPATFLDRRFLKRACDNCQRWTELHPLEAIDKGFSVSKFAK